MANCITRVMESLAECVGAPASAVPSVQYRIANFNFPFDSRQNTFFNQALINPFATNSGENEGMNFEQSDQLLADTFSLTGPFILMGICIYAYGEPFGFALDGNAYGPQSEIGALATFPGSPTLLRTFPQSVLDQLGLTRGAVPHQKVCQAQFDWGNPTWRAVWAFLHAFRIQVDCPNTQTGEYLVNEALADIGNCCSHSIPEGFGAGKTNWIKYVRLVNERLKQIQDAGLSAENGRFPIPNSDPDRYFFPFNVDQHLVPNATELKYEVDPYRQPVDFAAYGREFMNPTLEQWFRLGTPVKLLPDTKIRINLKPSTGSDAYRQRFLNEANIECCVSPVSALDESQDILLDEIALDGQAESRESHSWCKIPGGLWRFGVALKGFFVKPKVCAELDAACYARGTGVSGCVSGNLIGTMNP